MPDRTSADTWVEGSALRRIPIDININVSRTDIPIRKGNKEKGYEKIQPMESVFIVYNQSYNNASFNKSNSDLTSEPSDHRHRYAK